MIDFIEEDVKSMILKVSGLPNEPANLADGTKLSNLGYNDVMCDDLAETLNDYVKSKKSGAKVISGELSPGITAGSCVKLIKNKLQ